MWCQSVSRAHCWPSTMAWAFCVCHNCSCNGGCVTGWIESMVIRTIWRIREASGSSQHRALLSSSYRISRMCLYIVPIIELVNIWDANLSCNRIVRSTKTCVAKTCTCTVTVKLRRVSLRQVSLELCLYIRVNDHGGHLFRHQRRDDASRVPGRKKIRWFWPGVVRHTSFGARNP